MPRRTLAVGMGSHRKSGSEIGLGAAGAMIGLLHDIGKYSRDFQRYLRQIPVDQDTEQQLKRGSVDHSTVVGRRRGELVGRSAVAGVPRLGARLGDIAKWVVTECLAPG